MVLAAKRQEVYEEISQTPTIVSRPAKKVKRRLRVHPMILLFMIVIAVAGLTALGISQKIRAIELEYQLQALEAKLHQVQREGQQLQLRVEQLQSLAKIDTLARDRLGMVDPEGARVLALGDWELLPSTQMATNSGPRQVLARETKRLWAVVYQWVGARLPTMGTAEAGLMGR